LRAYLASRFFEPHLKRYSKSRRKAPIDIHESSINYRKALRLAEE
jgi:hypothetical protein